MKTKANIIAAIESNNVSFDLEKIDRMYHNKYPDELAHYTLVKPFEIRTQIGKGSVIKYTKKNQDELSITALVTAVEYSYLNDAVQCFLLRRINKQGAVWKIFPSNHYIFVYSKIIGDQRISTKIKEIAQEQGRNYKNIELTPKTRNRLLKNCGMTDGEIEKTKILDEKLEKIFNSNKTKKNTYGSTLVTRHNLDEMAEKILYEENYTKIPKKLKKTKK